MDRAWPQAGPRRARHEYRGRTRHGYVIGHSGGRALHQHVRYLNGHAESLRRGAILAQQHPDWTAAKLKSALMSTAKDVGGAGSQTQQVIDRNTT